MCIYIYICIYVYCIQGLGPAGTKSCHGGWERVKGQMDSYQSIIIAIINNSY